LSGSLRTLLDQERGHRDKAGYGDHGERTGEAELATRQFGFAGTFAVIAVAGLVAMAALLVKQRAQATAARDA
jgi:hypothetical protein